MNIHWSYQKRKNIKSLSNKLRKFRGIKDRSVGELFAEYSVDKSGDKNKHLELLINLCKNDPEISELMEIYKLTEEDLLKIFDFLETTEVNKVISDIYLPVATLLHPPALKIILQKGGKSHLAKDSKKSQKLLSQAATEIESYFNKNLQTSFKDKFTGVFRGGKIILFLIDYIKGFFKT